MSDNDDLLLKFRKMMEKKKQSEGVRITSPSKEIAKIEDNRNLQDAILFSSPTLQKEEPEQIEIENLKENLTDKNRMVEPAIKGRRSLYNTKMIFQDEDTENVAIKGPPFPNDRQLQPSTNTPDNKELTIVELVRLNENRMADNRVNLYPINPSQVSFNDSAEEDRMNLSEPNMGYSMLGQNSLKERNSSNKARLMIHLRSLKNNIKTHDLAHSSSSPNFQTLIKPSETTSLVFNSIIDAQPRKSVRDMIRDNEKRLKEVNADPKKKRNSSSPSNKLNMQMKEIKKFIEQEKSIETSLSDFYQMNTEKLKEFGITNKKDFLSVHELIEFFENNDNNQKAPLGKNYSDDTTLVKKRNTVAVNSYKAIIDLNVPVIKEENDEEVQSVVESVRKSEQMRSGTSWTKEMSKTPSGYPVEASINPRDIIPTNSSEENLIEVDKGLVNEMEKGILMENEMKEDLSAFCHVSKPIVEENANKETGKLQQATLIELPGDNCTIQNPEKIQDIRTHDLLGLALNDNFTLLSYAKKKKYFNLLSLNQEINVEIMSTEDISLKNDICADISIQLFPNLEELKNKKRVEYNRKLFPFHVVNLSIPGKVTHRIEMDLQVTNIEFVPVPKKFKLSIKNVVNLKLLAVKPRQYNSSMLQIESKTSKYSPQFESRETPELKQIPVFNSHAEQTKNNFSEMPCREPVKISTMKEKKESEFPSATRAQKPNTMESNNMQGKNIHNTNDVNSKYQRNIISSLDAIAVTHYTVNPLLPLDPSFLDILCTNCYDSVKLSDIDYHSQICVIPSEDLYRDNEEFDDYNARIFKLHESLKRKKNEILMTKDNVLISIYDELVKLVYDILINNNSIEELDRSISSINSLISNKLNTVTSHYKFSFLIFGKRISQLVFTKLKNMEKVLMLVGIKEEEVSDHDSLDDMNLEDNEDDVDPEQIKYIKMQLSDIENQTLKAQLELKQWKREAKILEHNLRRPIQNSEILSDIASDVNSRKDESFDGITMVTGQTSEVDPNDIANMKDIEGLAESEEEAKKYFLSVGLGLKFKHSEKIKENVSIADLYDKAKQRKVPISEWYNFISQELNINK